MDESTVSTGRDVQHVSTGVRYLCVRVRGDGGELVLMYDSRYAQMETHGCLIARSPVDAP